MSFYWDKEKRVYREDDGTIIPESKIKRILDDILTALALLFIDFDADYRAGKMPFDAFMNDIKSNIEDLHYMALALALGGFSNLEQKDTSLVEQYIRDQEAYLYMLMTQIYNQTVSDKQSQARLAMYAFAGYSTYENTRLQREVALGGFTIYRRIRKPHNSCDDCIDYAARNWQLIGRLPGIGQDCACKSNCRCYFEFSNDLALLGGQ
jgi:hypothetical protein